MFEVSGLAMATRDADMADDNMSETEGDDDAGNGKDKLDEADKKAAEERRLKRRWRKILHALRDVPAKRCAQVREHVANAITAARKAKMGDVLSELREAMMEYQPDAAGECRRSAIAVLDKHGGYKPEEEDDDEDDDSDDNDDTQQANDDEDDDDDEIPSNLSGEAMMMTGSLLGDDDANRVDWRDAVKSCRTLSRFGALLCAFSNAADTMMAKMEGEREALHRIIEMWEKEEARKARSRKTYKLHPNTERALNKRTEVWADVNYTDDICMVKLDTYPSWPARKCTPKDPSLAASLHPLNLELVSLVGEDGNLRLVKPSNVTEFTGSIDDKDLAAVQPDLQSQLVDCITMARRIVRGIQRERDNPQPKRKKSRKR